MVVVKVIEVDLTTLAAGCETEVVLLPVNTFDLLDVATKLHEAWAVKSIEVVNVERLLQSNTSEKMTTVRELNLSATLAGNALGSVQRLAQDIVNFNLIRESHHDVQARGVECHSVTLIRESLLNLKLAVMIVPNTDLTILGAGNDELFSDAHIEASNLRLVELTLNVIEASRVRQNFFGFAVQPSRNHLPLSCDAVKFILFAVQGHTLDDVLGLEMLLLSGNFKFALFTVDLEGCAIIHIAGSVDVEITANSDQEPILKRDNGLDG